MASSVHANGNHTHIAITLHAISHLPDGPLRQLASDPTLRRMLVGGTIFPDGGYAVGHGYGEAAHWEPFQRALAQRVRDVCPTLPGDAACRARYAFLLGMASHGMADQVFDGLFMVAAKVHDKKGWDHGTFTSLDTMSDVIWAARHGAADSPQLWLPLDDLLAAYNGVGIAVTSEKISDGQFLLLNAALGYVRNAAKDPKKVAEAEARYPWSAAHLDDEHTAGSPYCEGRIVAAYWQHLWAGWQSAAAPTLEVLATLPSDGGQGVVADHGSPDAIVAVVLSRGLDDSETKPAKVRAVAADGAVIPLKLDVFYGQHAHMLRLLPKSDWPTGQDVTVTLDPGAVTSYDGVPLASSVQFVFRAGADNAVAPGRGPPGWRFLQAEPPGDAGGSADTGDGEPADGAPGDSQDGDIEDGDSPGKGSSGSGAVDSGCTASAGGHAPSRGAAWLLLLPWVALVTRRRVTQARSGPPPCAPPACSGPAPR